MSAYTAIATYLDTQGIATAGSNLFVNDAPPSPDTLLVVYATPAIYDPNNILSPYDTLTFQLYARSKTEALATGMLDSAYSALQNLGGVTLSGIYFVEIVALAPGYNFIGKDSLNRRQYTQNYRCMVYNPTAHRA